MYMYIHVCIRSGGMYITTLAGRPFSLLSTSAFRGGERAALFWKKRQNRRCRSLGSPHRTLTSAWGKARKVFLFSLPPPLEAKRAGLVLERQNKGAGRWALHTGRKEERRKKGTFFFTLYLRL